jgi:hypothetical protein
MMCPDAGVTVLSEVALRLMMMFGSDASTFPAKCGLSTFSDFTRKRLRRTMCASLQRSDSTSGFALIQRRSPNNGGCLSLKLIEVRLQKPGKAQPVDTRFGTILHSV